MRSFKVILFALLVFSLCSCAVIENPFEALTGSTAESSAKSSAESSAENPEDGLISVDNETAGTVLDYFAEIAFASEYGTSPGRVCRWEDEIVYEVTGTPTETDLELIDYLTGELNSIEGFPGIREKGTGDRANFKIMFISQGEILEEFEDAPEGCTGMSQFNWETDTCRIISAKAAISNTEVEERESTVCEEILQSLGLAMDSHAHPDSVFYQGRCVYKRPSKLDFTIVKLLYNPALDTGMPKSDAISAAANLLPW